MSQTVNAIYYFQICYILGLQGPLISHRVLVPRPCTDTKLWGSQVPYVKMKVTQSCLTLCDPMDCSLSGFSVHGVLQARRVGSHSLLQGIFPTQDWTQDSCFAGRFFTIWAAREASEYWIGQPIPSPGDLPNPGIELGSPALQADALPSEPPGKTNWLKIQQ